MADPQTITIDDVRPLLAAEDGVLVLLEGRIETVPSAQLNTDEYRGALELISHTGLLEQVGADADDEALGQVAAGLTSAVQHMGG